MKLFISAGEPSGDLHASRLISAIKTMAPDTEFRFLGGDLMAQAAGVQPEIHYSKMAFMGFSEVIRHLPDILANLRMARKALTEFKPDALVLVDYPDFNLKLAKAARKAGIKVFYYIPPKVWAWKSWRVKTLRKLIDGGVMAIFPFEPPFLKSHGLEKCVYVGNPSVEEVFSRLIDLPSREEFVAEHDITSRPLIALVPGSRRSEIKNNLPVMAAAVQPLRNHQAVVAAAPNIPIEFYRQFTNLPIVEGDTLALMTHSEAALVTSGTATLECALAGTPQVVCYRANGSRLSYALMRKLIKVDHVALPNLIAGRTVVPEMLLHNCTPALVEEQLRNILTGTEGRRRQLQGYADIRLALGTNDAPYTAAKYILEGGD